MRPKWVWSEILILLNCVDKGMTFKEASKSLCGRNQYSCEKKYREVTQAVAAVHRSNAERALAEELAKQALAVSDAEHALAEQLAKQALLRAGRPAPEPEYVSVPAVIPRRPKCASFTTAGRSDDPRSVKIARWQPRAAQ